MPHPIEDYLIALRTTRMTGGVTDETASYPALKALLDAIGADLSPRVHCELHPTGGAGIPDGGLFTAEQIQRGDPTALLRGARPARGVIEVKPVADDIDAVVASEQVAGYFSDHRQVLVTNYRDFVFLAQNAEGRRAEFGRFRLADSEADFWALTAHPRAAANRLGKRFADFMQRVMTHAAPLCDPADVAWLLASYAREAMARVEQADIPALQSLREALEEALGLTFEGDRGDHFFRSTLVQTLFYGIFSAWVIWSHERPPTARDRFDWHAAEWTLHVPMIAALYHQIAQPARLGPLRVVEVLDWAAEALNRVDRASFFAQFDEGQAVQYFYEPFLQAFDPELRKQLGVWYTPTEIVQYMVERVDRVLREELDVPDGLADPNVYVLDPCCGTGAYLVEVLRRIERTLRQRGGDDLVASDIKRAAINRVFGFEIMPAPFVVAHLQLGLTLRNLGAPLAETERAGVYLTNALTGWEPPDETKAALPFPEFQAEADAADHVKREVPILVVLGNPPYNGFAGIAIGEERALVEAYRETHRAPRPEGQGLNDLYVRFFRIAERQITERTGRGIVCFISNYSWLDARSFSGMRERYLDAFDRIWIDNLNGDKYRTGKRTPDGRPDPSVFSTEAGPAGIQVGTAIALLLRRADRSALSGVLYRDLWGTTKRAELLESAGHDGRSLYDEVDPQAELGFPLMPRTTAAGYFDWPTLPALFPSFFPGIKTSRDRFLVDTDREVLVARLRDYFDPSNSDAEIAAQYPHAMRSHSRCDGAAARAELVERGFLSRNIQRYAYRPMDVRWVYWEPDTKLIDEKRAEYVPHVAPGNPWMSAEERNRKAAFYTPQVTELLSDLHITEFGAALFPLWTATSEVPDLFGGHLEARAPNTSGRSANYLLAVDRSPADLFYHALAVQHATTYADENAGALRQDWPRVPLPDSGELLAGSAALGREVAALLDTEAGVPGVTEGDIRPELRVLGVLSSVDGSPLRPEAGDLAVTAGWGYLGARDATMPGQGRLVERDYTPEELAAIEEGAAALGLSLDEALAQLGRATADVYLNDRAYWRNIPEGVWNYYIGGYQVIKKWLSYRERRVLGRDLRGEEARHVTEMVRRIAAILLLQPRLDENYQRVKAQTFDWSSLPDGNDRAGT